MVHEPKPERYERSPSLWLGWGLSALVVYGLAYLILA